MTNPQCLHLFKVFKKQILILTGEFFLSTIPNAGPKKFLYIPRVDGELVTTQKIMLGLRAHGTKVRKTSKK